MSWGSWRSWIPFLSCKIDFLKYVVQVYISLYIASYVCVYIRNFPTTLSYQGPAKKARPIKTGIHNPHNLINQINTVIMHIYIYVDTDRWIQYFLNW